MNVKNVVYVGPITKHWAWPKAIQWQKKKPKTLSNFTSFLFLCCQTFLLSITMTWRLLGEKLITQKTKEDKPQHKMPTIPWQLYHTLQFYVTKWFWCMIWTWNYVLRNNKNLYIFSAIGIFFPWKTTIVCYSSWHVITK